MYFFFFKDTATTEIYTLSLHDALPIYPRRIGPPEAVEHVLRLRRRQPDAEVADGHRRRGRVGREGDLDRPARAVLDRDRKSTRLNSSHANISYAVFCLKKKKNHYSL